MRIELNRYGDWPTAREAERADETSVKMEFFFLLFETWPFLREASFHGTIKRLISVTEIVHDSRYLSLSVIPQR